MLKHSFSEDAVTEPKEVPVQSPGSEQVRTLQDASPDTHALHVLSENVVQAPQA